MLMFSHSQFRRLGESAQRRFERDVEAHVRHHFADRFYEFGEVPCLALLRHALAGASHFGFTLQPDVFKWVNLVFEFGPGFGEPGVFEWADQILLEAEADGGHMARLYAAAVSHCGQPG